MSDRFIWCLYCTLTHPRDILLIYILRELLPACETPGPLKLIVPKWQSESFFISMEHFKRHHHGEVPLTAVAMKSITVM